MTAASVVQCSPLPSFQCRSNSSLCFSDFPHTFDGALLCVSPGVPALGVGLGGLLPGFYTPRQGAGQGGLGLYTTPRAALLAWSWARGLQLSVDLLLLVFSRALEFVLASGSFVSPDSAPPPPGFWEGSRRRWSAGRTRCAERGDDPLRRLGLLQPSQQLSIKNAFILKTHNEK